MADFLFLIPKFEENRHDFAGIEIQDELFSQFCISPNFESEIDNRLSRTIFLNLSSSLRNRG